MRPASSRASGLWEPKTPGAVCVFEDSPPGGAAGCGRGERAALPAGAPAAAPPGERAGARGESGSAQGGRARAAPLRPRPAAAGCPGPSLPRELRTAGRLTQPPAPAPLSVDPAAGSRRPAA